jgi:hypothetical protein
MWSLDTACSTQLVWAARGTMSNPRASAVPNSRHVPASKRVLQLAATTQREGTPIIQLAHFAVDAASSEAEIRSAVIDLVDLSEVPRADDPALWQRTLALHAVSLWPLAASTGGMTHFEVRRLQCLSPGAAISVYVMCPCKCD